MPAPQAMRRRILEAAVATLAAEGVSASTAAMAKRAGIAQGSIFHHFESKAGLLNALYLELAEEVRAAVLADIPAAGLREQLLVVWGRWLDWAAEHPARRRSLMLLSLSDVITAESRAGSARNQAAGVELFQRAAAGGPLDGQPIAFLGAVVEGVAYAAMDAIQRDPERAGQYHAAGFAALWNLLRPA
ncbi:TetR/AcrR family transcriptional regulator [Dactylosporangium sp. NPDC051541]|uniref:TetR/AcrR family transcriptional regulator n=1 Tax=Dactylosporangium sp. NPDC051541 TaxID=3363977 RepID=UPI0037A7D0DA